DEGDDAELHVLVDAGEAYRLDRDPGLLLDLAAQPVLDGLVEFEDAAGKLPGAVVTALDDEDTALVVRDDCGHADGVAGRLAHHWLPPANSHTATVASSWRLYRGR